MPTCSGCCACPPDHYPGDFEAAGGPCEGTCLGSADIDPASTPPRCITRTPTPRFTLGPDQCCGCSFTGASCAQGAAAGTCPDGAIIDGVCGPGGICTPAFTSTPTPTSTITPTPICPGVRVNISVAASADDGIAMSQTSNLNCGQAACATVVTGDQFIGAERQKGLSAFGGPGTTCANTDGFLRFNTTGIPTGSLVLDASLRISLKFLLSPVPSNFNGEYFPWTPPLTCASWAAAPGSNAFSVPLASLSTPTWPVFDVPLTNPDANLVRGGFSGFRLSVDGSFVTYGSQVGFRSADTAAPPVLSVCYTLPTPTLTPTRTPTPSPFPTGVATYTATPTLTPIVCNSDADCPLLTLPDLYICVPH